MAKFYVQCGPVQTILLADSVEQAALAAMDHSLQAHLWIYDDPQLSESDCHDHLMLEALLHLDSTIRISERGFNRSDASVVGVPETIQSWHQLMVGMRRLFVVAGLAPRSMATVAGHDQTTEVDYPRLPR
ncbi:MAG: hypothetical protein HKN47_19045 [Pirellulaceae bacterium]|nr:hypothetical protein [Pirellulaceae bacterium]